MTQESSGQVEEGRAERRTRLAPSPTGALHLGNARTFVVNWVLARQRGWRVLLRMEDLDGPRVKPEAAEGVHRVFAWLGLDWDEGPVTQSDDLGVYIQAMERLVSSGRAYACAMTRREILEALSAPQEGSHEICFPASLRPDELGTAFDDPSTGWRFVTPDTSVEFVDEFCGAQSIRVGESVGDFVVWTKQSVPGYQLAVVVDDARQGVTDVVRGDDLLDSAARQKLLYDALGYGGWPEQIHLPLVVGEDGRRLAKRHGDTRVEHYRERGAGVERVIGLLASWCGIGAEEVGVRGPRVEMGLAEFCERFELGKMPREVVTFSKEDDAWLMD